MVKLLHRQGRHGSTKDPPQEVRSREVPSTVESADAAEHETVTTAHRSPVEASADSPDQRTRVLRVPTMSPLAPMLGVLLSWGAIATAAAILEGADVEIGFNLGIADGGVGAGGFFAGLWLLLVSFGAFLAGGYAVARMARANGIVHAALMWVVAMIATAADAIVEMFSDGTTGAIQQISGVPFWAESGLTDGYERTVVFIIFAAAALAGALVGGGLGQVANRVERSDNVFVVPAEADRRIAPSEETGDLVVEQPRTEEVVTGTDRSEPRTLDEERTFDDPDDGLGRRRQHPQ